MSAEWTTDFTGGFRLDRGQSGKHPGHLLDRSERRAVDAGKHQGGHNRGPAIVRLEQGEEARPLERAIGLLLFPNRYSGRKGRMMINGIAGMSLEINV